MNIHPLYSIQWNWTQWRTETKHDRISWHSLFSYSTCMHYVMLHTINKLMPQQLVNRLECMGLDWDITDFETAWWMPGGWSWASPRLCRVAGLYHGGNLPTARRMDQKTSSQCLLCGRQPFEDLHGTWRGFLRYAQFETVNIEGKTICSKNTQCTSFKWQISWKPNEIKYFSFI